MAKIYRFTLILIVAMAVLLIPSTFAWFSQSGNTKGQLDYTFSARSSSSISISANNSISNFTPASVSGLKLLGAMNASTTFGEVKLSMLDKFELTSNKWVNNYSTTAPSSTATPNAVKLTASFTPSERNVYTTEVSVSPTVDTSSNDQKAVEALAYVVYVQNGSTKTLLDNSAFTYFTGSETKKAVITRDGYFEGIVGTTYTITAIVWLDGFVPQAESGGVNVKITFGKVSDFYSSVTSTSSGDGVSDLYITGSGEVIGFFNDIEHIRIPPAFYKDKVTKVIKINQNIFKNKTSIKSVYIPDSITNSISARTFYNCTNLESVTFGNSVPLIGNGCFLNASKLSSVTFNNPYQWARNNNGYSLNLENRTPQEIALLINGADDNLTNNPPTASTSTKYDWKAGARATES